MAHTKRRFNDRSRPTKNITGELRLKIAILNASNPRPDLLQYESDVYVDYRAGRSSCFDGAKNIKQCRSWNSWTYALETEFFVYLKEKWTDVYKYDAVIVLVNREIQEVLPLVKKLKLMKKKVAISFHESVSDFLSGSGIGQEDLGKRWVALYDLVQEADFYINLFGQVQSFFQGWFGANKVKYCNHGAPMDWNHGFTKPYQDRKYDILIGTRTFNQRITRNTLVSMGVLNGVAREWGRNVHYLSEDGDVAPLLKRMGLNNITVHRGPLKWEDWLEFLSNFKIVASADNSINLSQITMDCAMVDVHCIGGTCWNQMLVGGDDHGDFDTWANRIFAATTTLDNYEQKEKFKQSLHPDVVKENLIKLFGAD